MVFFSINSHSLEIVQEYTYLGVKITTSGSFNSCQKTLTEKVFSACFKIYTQIDLFRLSLRWANEIVDAAIALILAYEAEMWGCF